MDELPQWFAASCSSSLVELDSQAAITWLTLAKSLLTNGFALGCERNALDGPVLGLYESCAKRV